MIWFTQQSTSPLWGDGFDSDDWSDIVALSDWGRCSPDEMIRVFPVLAHAGSRPSKFVVDRILECVTVLSWRMRSAGADAYIAKSVSSATIEKLGLLWADRWFRARRKQSQQNKDPRAESAAVVLIDDIAQEISDDRLRAFDPKAAAEFVYWTGIHPVYLWPEALLSHALYTAIGWIGHAERYQQALMTQDIAEYFSVTISRTDSKGHVVLDSQLSPYVRSKRAAALILKSANEYLDGRRPIVRLTPSAQKNESLSVWSGVV